MPPWSLCAVYGPVDDSLKPDFLSELRDVHTTCPGALLFCGDFNLIYQAQDKSNSRLNLAAMRHFHRTLDAMAMDELYFTLDCILGVMNGTDPPWSISTAPSLLCSGWRRFPTTGCWCCPPIAWTTRRFYYSFPQHHEPRF